MPEKSGFPYAPSRFGHYASGAAVHHVARPPLITLSYRRGFKGANLSKSAAHRVCPGQSVPPEFGTVERIARLCDATDEDIARLFRLWQSATAARTTDSIPVVPGPVSVLLPPEQPVAFQRLRSV